MFNNFKAKKAGDWKEKKSFGRDDRGPVEMHEAECAKCHQMCQVPFKPNGRKPVFCSDCFRRDGADADTRPAYGDKRPSFRDRDDRSDYHAPERSYERPERAPERSNDRQMAEVLGEMRIMNSKLEAILKALTAGNE